MTIYLDYNATTPIDPAVRAAMQPFLDEHFGNPSSAHAFGPPARAAIDRARRQIADLLGTESEEIVFTGGGSEASNLAIKGVAFSGGLEPKHFITTAIEHPATLQPLNFLRRIGHAVTILPVDGQGVVDPNEVRRAITSETALISVMHANNEVGTLEPIRDIAAIARSQGVILHVDAAQSVGKVPIDVHGLGVDLLTVAGHKFYAPKGVGALVVRRGVTLEPLIHGASHESGRRAGTENLASIVGLGAAAELAQSVLPAATERMRRLRDRLWERLKEGLADRIVLNGHPRERLPNTLNASFVGWTGADVLAGVPEIAASTGSACHDGQVRLSPVLAAMSVPPEIGRGAVRFSLGRSTSEAEIDRAAELLLRRVR